MKLSTIFRKARRLISNPKRWGKGKWAKTKDGDERNFAIDAEDAVCFCAEGAILRACGVKSKDNRFSEPLSVKAIKMFISCLPKKWQANTCRSNAIFLFNDAKHRTHQHVLNAFDRAIVKAVKLEAKAKAIKDI